MLDSSRYMSTIIDGADQSANSLTHFCAHTKAETGIEMKVLLVSVLQHSQPNQLLLMTMTEELESGSKHIDEALHRCLNNQEKELPRTLFLQVDICTEENKNKYMFSFIALCFLCFGSWRPPSQSYSRRHRPGF